MLDAAYKRSLVEYCAEVMAARTGQPLEDARDAVTDPIQQELRYVEDRGLVVFALPMGRMMIGVQESPNKTVARYIDAVREQENLRWRRHRVTEEDIVAWWDLGIVVQRCWAVIDNLISGAQFLGAMRSRSFESMEEAADFSAAHVKKWCALYGDAKTDDGTPDGRLPLELRNRVDA